MREKDTISARCLNNIELLRCYSIHIELITLDLDNLCYTEWLDNIIQYGIPFCLYSFITSQLISHSEFNDNINYEEIALVDNHQYYHMAASPTAIDWTNVYMNDTSTKVMMPILQNI